MRSREFGLFSFVLGVREGKVELVVVVTIRAGVALTGRIATLAVTIGKQVTFAQLQRLETGRARRTYALARCVWLAFSTA